MSTNTFRSSSSTSAAAISASCTVDGRRLMQTITEMGAIGALPEGGVRRLAFSPEDIQARDIAKEWMQTAGMTVRIDTAGNLIGHYPGRFPDAPALVTGSHLDTVPNAGIYDGTYGVLAGIEVARTLHDQGIQLDHPFEVIVFADEERTMIGSKAIANQASLTPSDYAHPHYDPIEPCVNRIGGDWNNLPAAQRDPGSLAAFVEVHVEQGPVLETAGNPMGLVTGIVGQRRFLITFTGQASHAGTTPMSLRQDALLAASQVVLVVNEIGRRRDDLLTGEQVATVGSMQLTPNVANTIPGQVELTVDMRDLSNDCLDRMYEMLADRVGAIAAQTETEFSIKPQLRNEPVLASTHIQNTIAEVCKTLELPAISLPSRASHDAQIIGGLTDMGMIFVPSQAGISHAETEYTAPEHCIQGANVLLHTILQLDQHYRCAADVERSVETNTVLKAANI